MDFAPEKIIERITAIESDAVLKTVYPHFIASEYDLEIRVVKVNGRYYAHENGCVVRRLKESGIYPLFEKNREKLEKVFGAVLVGEKFQRGYKEKERGYFDFIKNLIFILNFDIILPYLDTEEAYVTEDYDFTEAEYDDVSDCRECTRLKLSEKDDGYLISSGICYSYSDVFGSSVFMKQCEGGTVYIDDGETHFEFRRDVTELLLQSDDGISVYGELVDGICKKYGVEFADSKISMISEPDTETLLDNYFRFLQAAVILSEIGDGGKLHCKF